VKSRAKSKVASLTVKRALKRTLTHTSEDVRSRWGLISDLRTLQYLAQPPTDCERKIHAGSGKTHLLLASPDGLYREIQIREEELTSTTVESKEPQLRPAVVSTADRSEAPSDS